MDKDSLVCFRVRRELQEALVKISLEERSSLSSLIEIVLTNYLTVREMSKKISHERRNHPRKSILAPALIKQYGSGKIKLEIGAITDISLGGVRIAIPRDAKCEMSDNSYSSAFEIVFTLPNENMPIYLSCEPRRVVDYKESINVGASFRGIALNNYKELQTYLM
ncbi:MAG: PilZ domain-containing protein [Syntrophaceae bacterium]